MASSSQLDSMIWSAVDAYFSQDKNQLIRHQIDSYDDFVMNKIDQITRGFNPIEIPYKYNSEEEIFEYKIFVEFKNPSLTYPMIIEKNGSTSLMTPSVAIDRNFTYAGNLYIDMHIDVNWYENGHIKDGSKIIKSISLGKLPVMVNSSYCMLRSPNVLINEDKCRMDNGGYFIINGNEKVIVCQDRIAENKIYVFHETKGPLYSHIAEIRSVQDNIFGSPKLTSLRLSAKPTQYGRFIRVNLHYIRTDVPIFVLFRALGVETDMDIMRFILCDIDDENYGSLKALLIGSVNDSQHIRTMKDALEWMASVINVSGVSKDMLNNRDYKISIVRDILAKDLLPHLGPDPMKKAYFLGTMVKKLLLCYMDVIPVDDRDSYINKRVDTPGMLLSNLFRQYYGKMVKDMKTMIYKEYAVGSWKTTNNPMNIINMNNLYKIVKVNTIESGIKYALATGNWGIKNMNIKQGVAQVLNRLTFNATLSHLRRINTPMEKSGKLVQPRKLHNTQWGIICPSETPEGASVGLVKNMATSCTVTMASNSMMVRTTLMSDLGVIPFSPKMVHLFAKFTTVTVNGDILGVHDQPEELLSKLKQMKRKGVIHIHSSVSWNVRTNIIAVCTEAGRCVRPLFIVDSGNNLRYTEDIYNKLANREITWNNLVCSGMGMLEKSVVEYVDLDEVENSMVAMKYSDLLKGNKGSLLPVKYAYMEIHPSLILGVMANNVPFPDHNQAPRVTYQSAMGKQALGVHVKNFRTRMDTMSHVLNYPQKPLVRTRISDLINSNEMSAGTNVIIAIATFTGYNQEDSVMVNRSSLERGLFNSTFYRTYKEHCNKNHSTGEEEVFCNPVVKNAKKLKPFNYEKLNDTGFVDENVYVENGDIIIGKCMPQKKDETFLYKDNSIVLKNNEAGFIDRVCANDKYFKNVNADGYVYAKVRLRNMRCPVIGDKVSSRHGQKGTIGMTYNQEDMPFTQSGIVPDLIMNPHAVPSRMTIGQLLECIMSKSCTSLGTFGDATPFTDLSVHDLTDLLQKCGYEAQGNEIMYNPRTGEQMTTTIFIGPTFYQRLKHMVQDKIHCFQSDTEVLTMDGWKFIPEVTTSDLVATLKDDKLVYDHPTATLRFDYSGKMYHIKNSSIDLNVTINHRMYVSKPYGRKCFWQPPTLIKAEELVGKHVKYVKSADWDAPDYQFVLPSYKDVKEKVVHMDSWLTFFGIWMAEGWSSQGCNYVQLAGNKQRVRDHMAPALLSMDFNFRIDKALKITITNAQLANYMQQFSVGAPNKTLPDWCWKLSKRQSQVLLHGMVLGDGSFVKNGTDRWIYYTASTKLADDVMRLCLHCGWSGTIGTHIDQQTAKPVFIRGRQVNSVHDILRVAIIKDKNMPSVNHGHHKTQDVQEEKVYDYEGPVYCLQVPSEVFYVRRNGKSCWTGNSRSSSGPIVLMTRQPSEGRARDGGLRLGEMEADAIISHGAMSFLKERMLECSDNYRVFVCKKCKTQGNVNPQATIYKCHNCNNTLDFCQIRMPYACKLLLQEIQTMGVAGKIVV